MYEAIGIESMVLHCDNMAESGLGRDEIIEKNIEKLKEIADYIKGRKITICLENLRTMFGDVDTLLYITDAVGTENFGICLDTGHLNLSENRNQREFILKAADRLKVIHIANNDGDKDAHMMPYARGSVDFVEVFGALMDIGFDMPINYEIPGESVYFCPLEIRNYKVEYIKKVFEYIKGQAEKSRG